MKRILVGSLGILVAVALAVTTVASVSAQNSNPRYYDATGKVTRVTAATYERMP